MLIFPLSVKDRHIRLWNRVESRAEQLGVSRDDLLTAILFTSNEMNSDLDHEVQMINAPSARAMLTYWAKPNGVSSEDRIAKLWERVVERAQQLGTSTYNLITLIVEFSDEMASTLEQEVHVLNPISARELLAHLNKEGKSLDDSI